MHFTKLAINQDTGRALQRGDDASALSAEAQAVNDARNTPSVVSKVSGEGFRD